MRSYAVADVESLPREAYLERLAELARYGVDLIQLRARERSRGEIRSLAAAVRHVTRGSGVTLLLNTEAAIARELGFDGIHLPANAPSIASVRASSPGMVIGRSCHSAADCFSAAEQGADYVILGPIHPPRSKPGTHQVVLSELREAVACGIPLYAVGGISADNLEELAGTGIAGVAGITMFMRDEPLAELLEEIRRL